MPIQSTVTIRLLPEEQYYYLNCYNIAGLDIIDYAINRDGEHYNRNCEYRAFFFSVIPCVDLVNITKNPILSLSFLSIPVLININT